MKHKKEVDEYFRVLAFNWNEKAFWDAIDQRIKISYLGLKGI